MRLIISEADELDVQSALSHLKVQEGVSVKINPQWLQPDPDEPLWIACGGPAVKMVQAAGWIPKKGGVEANRGKLFQNIQPDGWSSPLSLGITYAPQVRNIEIADWVKLETDLGIYRRFEKTGSMDAILGNYQYVPDLSGVIAYLKAKHALTGLPVELSLDTETEGLDPYNPAKQIVCLQATAKPGITDVIYTLGMSWAHIQKHLLPQLEWIAAQPWIRLVGANFKYDMGWVREKWGIDLCPRFAFDTCNGGSLVDENRPNTLELHTKIYAPDLGGYDTLFNASHDKSKMGEVPKADLLPYAGGDTDACLRNYGEIRKELLSDNLTKNGKPAKNSLASVYLNIVHPTLKALHKMERTGVCVDTDKFHAFGADLEGRMIEATKKAVNTLPKWVLDKAGGLDEHGGAPLSKPKMIADFLFSPQGLNLKPVMTTEKTGAPSTSEQHLAHFKDHPDAGPLIEHYLDYKSTSKMHGTYYKGFLNHLRADNRWHASYIIHKQGSGKNNEQEAAGTVCVTADTLFTTTKGVIPYTALKKGDEVLTHLGKTKPITDLIDNGTRSVVRVSTADGNSLTCTENHPFLTQSGWVNASDLVIEQVVFSLSGAEEWRKVPDWPLQVSSWGRVTSHTGTILAQAPKGRWGHLKVSCCRDKKWVRGEHYKDFPVHRLVASVFVDNPENLPQVRHLNGLAWDNRADNLVWGTDQHNRNDMKNHGTGRGTKSNQKLTEQQIGFITKDPRTHTSIAKEYGVTRRLVGMVKSGERRSYQPTTPPKATFAPTKVSAIEVLPPQPTFGVTVKDAHSHVTNGLVTHNTGRGSATAPAFQCVTGETEILTPHGVRTAAQLIDPVIPDDAYNPFKAHEVTVWGGEGWETTTNVFKSWRSDLLRIRTKCGNQITCTPEHPIWLHIFQGSQSLQWVQAKDIGEADRIALPKPVTRAAPPEGYPYEAFEALGVIAAHGYLAATGDTLYIETKPEHSDTIMQAAAKLGITASRERTVDGASVRDVVRVQMVPDMPPRAVQWLLWIPHPSVPIIPYELRGTTAWHPILRGILKGAGEYMKGRKGRLGVRVRVNARSLTQVMVREAMFDGVIPPITRGRVDHFAVEYLGYTATYHLTAAGLPLMGIDYPPAYRKPVEGLSVISVEEAGAGWVYDFTLPKTHAFSANSMKVHNTVPKHSYWGKRLRECIVAPDGHVIVARDYSQGELKVAACWAGEQKMLQAYLNKIDLHVLTAATVNSMTYEEAMHLKGVDEAAFKMLRQNGKAGNFGLIYGMQAYGFMMYAEAVYGVKLTLEQAEAMRDAFFNLYPGLPYWHDRQIIEAQTNGTVRSPLGRLRHLPNINSPIKAVRKKAQNQAINSPIQATLVDMMWWSMAIIEEERPALLTPCGQIHDQGLWYVPEDEVDDALLYSGQVMEDLPFEKSFGWKPELKFTTDAEVGLNLAELAEVA